ncbi:hypothetical protein AB0H76_07310 [Nocardia sp. NPDC050712]|uniref:hypothetical protein n=1 Tax=Nocardia sp. NPDC050712 TaxID=3155518 RepID=UPI0033F74C43
MRALAQHARTHAGDPGFPALLTDLAADGYYGRRIALHMAMAARELDYVARVLAGSELGLRRAALRAVRTLPIPDAAVPPALVESSTELRMAVYRTIVHARRTELADRLLPEVAEKWGAGEAARLLPGCSPDVVGQWLPGLAHAVTTWKTLTRRHPVLVVRCLDAEFATTRGFALWRQRFPAIREAAAREPVLVLDLLERHGLGRMIYRLPGDVMGPLMRADLPRAAGLLSRLLRRRYQPKQSLLARCAGLGDDELVRLAGRRPGPLLRALPVSRRGAVYQRCDIYEREALALLHLLPHELAVCEARRLRQWHDTARHSSRAHLDDPRITLRITAFLPYSEAEPALRSAAFTGDPRSREAARGLLLRAAQRTGDRAATTAVLGELVERIRNERDPARAALLEGIAELRLDPLWAEHLERLVAAVVPARDTSERTRSALCALADRALNTEPALSDWALRTYARLIDRFGGGALSRPSTLGRVLRRGQERELLDLLEKPCDHYTTVVLAGSLGARLGALPELLADLRQIVVDGDERSAGIAAGMWLRHCANRDAQVAALLRDAPEAIRLEPVWRAVATRRTDLLPIEPGVLADHEVLPGMAGRWTDAQRESVGAALETIADDGDALIEERVRALRGLSRIPFHNAKLVEHALGGDPVLADTALGALGDYPRVLPRLLRIPGPTALATAAKLCRVSRPVQLRENLERALFEGRVGVRKLAARQLITQRVPGAEDLLLRAWAIPQLHPDVRIALAVALRRLPESDRARAALAQIPVRYNTEQMVRTLLQSTPEQYAPQHRAGGAELVCALLAAAEAPGVRFRAAKAFAMWAPWFERGVDEIVEAAVTGDDTDQTVFLALLRSGLIKDEALPVLLRLLAADRHGRVREIAGALTAARDAELWRRGLARAAAELLLDHPLHVVQAVRMLIYLLPSEEFDPETMAFELNALADRLTPVTAFRIVSSGHRLFGWNARSRSSLLPAIRSLIARGDVTGGVLAFGLIEHRTDEHREALQQLRCSPHLDIRRLAWEIG